MTPAAAETLNQIRSRADRVLALLIVAHFPVALALAPLHDTWLAAILWGGSISADKLSLFGALAESQGRTSTISSTRWPIWRASESMSPSCREF